MTKISITKLVLLILILCLIALEIIRAIKGNEYSDLFSNVVIAVVSFYFGQKGITYESIDSLIDSETTEEEKE